MSSYKSYKNRVLQNDFRHFRDINLKKNKKRNSKVKLWTSLPPISIIPLHSLQNPNKRFPKYRSFGATGNPRRHGFEISITWLSAAQVRRWDRRKWKQIILITCIKTSPYFSSVVISPCKRRLIPSRRFPRGNLSLIKLDQDLMSPWQQWRFRTKVRIYEWNERTNRRLMNDAHAPFSLVISAHVTRMERIRKSAAWNLGIRKFPDFIFSSTGFSDGNFDVTSSTMIAWNVERIHKFASAAHAYNLQKYCII